MSFNKNSIIFITAFKNIGRDKWEHYSRTDTEYIKYFINLAKNISYKLVVCTSEYYINLLNDYNLNSNIEFILDENIITFYNNYIDNEKKMISSVEYRNKIPENRKFIPEHWSAEYNLINHSKINYVFFVKKKYPNYEFYSWIDFGCIRFTIDDVPKFINFNKLEKKITYLCLEIPPDNIINANDMLKSDKIYIIGGQYIVHTSLVEKYEELYRELLELWKNQIICDDDQNAILQIYFYNKELFKLYLSNEWFSLFRNHLNYIDSIAERTDIHKIINLSNFTGKYIEIGVAQGLFTKYILDNTNFSILILIDPYCNFPSNEYIDAMNNYDMDKQFQICKMNLLKYNDKLLFVRKKSSDVFNYIEDNSIDVVYIDGNHAYTNVLEDITYYWKKLRSGGIIFGDDCYQFTDDKNTLKIWDGQPIEHSKSFGLYGVYTAVVDFCKIYKLQYYLFSNQFMIYKP